MEDTGDPPRRNVGGTIKLAATGAVVWFIGSLLNAAADGSADANHTIAEILGTTPDPGPSGAEIAGMILTVFGGALVVVAVAIFLLRRQWRRRA